MIECKLCGQKFNKSLQLTTHIQFHHKEFNSKLYYDKFFKKEYEGLCKTCGKQTLFTGINRWLQAVLQ